MAHKVGGMSWSPLPGRMGVEWPVMDVHAPRTAADISPFVVSGLHADSVTGARVQQVTL